MAACEPDFNQAHALEPTQLPADRLGVCGRAQPAGDRASGHPAAVTASGSPGRLETFQDESLLRRHGQLIDSGHDILETVVTAGATGFAARRPLGGVLGRGTPSARRSRRSGYDDPSTALSAAYYAMLYAARAALSEREIYAKTRRGAWHEFRREFVDTGKIDPALTRWTRASGPGAGRCS